MKKELHEVMGYFIPLAIVIVPFVWLYFHTRDSIAPFDFEMAASGTLVLIAFGPGILVILLFVWFFSLLIGFFYSLLDLIKSVFK